MTPEALRSQWLVGTTCAIKRRDVREILMFNDTHIVLKHRSHTEYIDRSCGNGTCGAYARLYARADLEEALRQRYSADAMMRLRPLLQWHGRLSTHNIKVDCAALGITFD